MRKFFYYFEAYQTNKQIDVGNNITENLIK